MVLEHIGYRWPRFDVATGNGFPGFSQKRLSGGVVMIKDNFPQRMTTVGTCDVSSICYDIFDDEGNVTASMDETCLFRHHSNDSEVVGSYHDHDAIVAALKFARKES